MEYIGKNYWKPMSSNTNKIKNEENPLVRFHNV